MHIAGQGYCATLARHPNGACRLLFQGSCILGSLGGSRVCCLRPPTQFWSTSNQTRSLASTVAFVRDFGHCPALNSPIAFGKGSSSGSFAPRVVRWHLAELQVDASKVRSVIKPPNLSRKHIPAVKAIEATRQCTIRFVLFCFVFTCRDNVSKRGLANMCSCSAYDQDRSQAAGAAPRSLSWRSSSRHLDLTFQLGLSVACCGIAAGTSNPKLSCHALESFELAISFETHISLSRIGCIPVPRVSRSPHLNLCL